MTSTTATVTATNFSRDTEGLFVRQSSRAPSVVVAPGLVLSSVFGTNAGITLVPEVHSQPFGVTSASAGQSVSARGASLTDEVNQLRDSITAAGLTRQHIARAVGVDRRSLLGWAKGEIRPTPERVARLRRLARVVAEIESERPGRAREVVLRQRRGLDLLDEMAAGRPDRLEDWRHWSARDASVVVERHQHRDLPLWAAAARALSAGDLPEMERSTTVRDERVYAMDLNEAASYAEPRSHEARRRDYQ